MQMNLLPDRLIARLTHWYRAGRPKLARSIFGNQRANMATLTAVSLVPLVGSVALAVDVGVAYSNRNEMAAAADAAAVKGVRVAIDYINEHMAPGVDPTQDGIDEAYKAANAAFVANLGELEMAEDVGHQVFITRHGSTIKVKVSYSAASSVMFGKAVGMHDLVLKGEAAAEGSLPAYFQIVFLVDVSNSMGIGGTAADITNLKAQLGCAFACHDPHKHHSNFDSREWARGKAKLKIDFVQDAIKAFLSSVDKAAEEAQVPKLYSVGIATFGTSYNFDLKPTTDLDAVHKAADKIDLEATTPPGTNWGFTNTTNALKYMLSDLDNIGDGTTPTKMKTFVVFVTDGVEDRYTPGYWYGGRDTGLYYQGQCPRLKAKNITLISILAPYPVVPEQAYYDLVAPHEPQINPVMRNCSSDQSKWFFNAADGPLIVDSMVKAFKNIQQVPTITD
jgi:hypothetical protein